MAEAREQRPARPFLSMLKRGDGRPGELRKWLTVNGPTVALLVFIFFLALFVRAYFGHDIAQDNGYLVSGGSDSYYWQRIVDYSSNTGKQLFWDPLINWPDGIRNPRPPFYSFSVVVPAVFTQEFFPSLEDAWGWQLMWSTAFWGALTIVPTYFLGKETFGRRAGLVAAFLLAVMPSHVQRSVVSDADHDAFILFFIVLTFYFMLKAVKTQQHKRWVEDWRSLASVRKGIAEYFRKSRKSVLYAAMAGVAYAGVIMAWVGFGYVTVLILAYYVIQVLLNKFKNVDSMSVTALIFVAMGVGFLLSFPVYYEQNLIAVRFDVPVYLWLASILLGGMFVVSRDYPWTMVLPTVGVVLAGAIMFVNFVDPALAQAILSGQGYFVKSKLYSTIAEARAPVFSELALSFGMVTFFLSLIGMLWAIWKVPKRIAAEYIFIVVWLGAAIFMAISAGRFMFNASPAFAIAAGWVTIMIIDRLDFGSVRKSLSGASGSYWQVFKKSVKVRHILGALFLAFMIILPNVWYSVDAGIPSEVKSNYDKQIYEDLPSLLRPSGYDAINGSNWYLGAFGYSIPLQKYYFPAAWEWFSEQDNSTFPIEKRPAYVAWWDYGFEAVQAGKHPTVADNFQNGYQLTGNAIVSQSEEEVIAIFAYRLIQAAYSEGGAKSAAVQKLLEQNGMSPLEWQDLLTGPGQPIIDKVLADPGKYGGVASDLGIANARIIAGRVELVDLGAEKLTNFYGALCDATGWEIRYFNVDSRMFPSSAQNTGIFYAPAKLADRRITGSSNPIDFFNVVGVDENGIQHDIDNITSDMTITQYKVIYKDAFYNSMFYRAMAGYSGTDIGQSSNDGIPGLRDSGSGAMDNYPAMPGWNLSHFKMVYRTAYFNPYSQDDLLGHSADWRAMSLSDVIELKTKIDNGELVGTVDTSAEAVYTAGTVFLKYYDGAFVNGTITTEEGYPVAGIRITVMDEWGIPHGTEVTDAKGHYSVLAPFGEVTLAITTGELQGLTQTGATSITKLVFNVTDDQAMRRAVDKDGDGVYDYLITKDYEMPGTEITGDVFWDVNKDGNYTAGTDILVNGTVVYGTERLSGQNFTIDAADGTFSSVLPAGQYDFVAQVLGRELNVASKFNVSGTKTETKLAIQPAVLKGRVSNVDGSPATGISVEMLDLASGVSAAITSDADGNYTFSILLGGKYSIITTDPGLMFFNLQVEILEGETLSRNITVRPSSTLNVRVTNGAAQVPYAVWMLVSNYNTLDVISGYTDQFGGMKLFAPRGKWTLYASHTTGSDIFASAVPVDTTVLDNQTIVISLQPAARVSGSVLSSTGLLLDDTYVTFALANGARVPIRTDNNGEFTIALPEGVYEVTSASTSTRGLFSGVATVARPASSIRIQMSEGVLLTGSIWLLKDVTEEPSTANLGRFADIKLTDSSSRVRTTEASSEGAYTLVVPRGTTVAVSVDEPGYSGWSTNVMITKGTSSFGLTADPDNVVVTGRLTSDGTGVRGVRIAFVPDDTELDTILVTTGADGAYSASVPPAKYTISVDQTTGPGGGEKYLFSLAQIVSPSSVPLTVDIPVTKKVQAIGNVPSTATGVSITFTGPEKRTIRLSATNYSVLLLPGEYDVYATGTVSGRPYASIAVVSITATTRQNDIALERAYTVSGMITLPQGAPAKSVAVKATSTLGTFVEVNSASGGRYSMSLPQGTYSVSYLLEDAISQAGRVVLVEYVGQQTVQVAGGDVVADASLTRRLDNTTFSGSVIGPDGQPLQATVELISRGTNGQNVTFSSDASGQFNVSVQPGDYVVYAQRVQDRRAALEVISFSRNLPRAQDIVLSDGRYLAGKVSIAGVGVQLPLSLATGTATLRLNSGADGTFRVLVPPGTYALSSSTTRTENSVTVSYSSSSQFTIGVSDVYIAQSLVRDTRHGALATWNSSNVQTAGVNTTVAYAVTITNTGNVHDRFLVTFTGTGFDVTITPAEVQLDFGVNNKALVVVEVAPKSSVLVGEQKVTCLVRSLDLATTRADLTLLVKVLPHRGVTVQGLNTSIAVDSMTTITSFNLNNTGNAKDDFVVNIANLGLLNSLGWNAVIIDPITQNETSTVSVDAFGTKALQVKYTALRADADASARATVFAYSKNVTSASSYGSIPIILPDLVVGRGDLSVERDDVSLVNTAQLRLATNIGLLIALVALVLTFYILRRRKGYGRASKGGAKK